MSGTIVPLATLFFATVGGETTNRPAMIALTLLLLATTIGIWLGADTLARSEQRQTISILSLLVHLGAYVLLADLESGMSGPLGLLPLFAVVYLAVNVPFRSFVLLAGWTTAAYAIFAAIGDEPLAPVVVPAIIVVGAGVSCARHSSALRAYRRRLSETSRIDPATGYLNRRGFDERFDQELSRASRSNQPLTLVVVNPDLGPVAVDQDGLTDVTLSDTARALGETARTHDSIGRLGPDDFAMILTDTGPEAAAIVVDRLRDALAGPTPARVGHASFPAEAAHPQALHRLATQRSNAYRFVRRRHARPVHVHRPTSPADATSRAGRVRQPLGLSDLAALAALIFGTGVAYAALSEGVARSVLPLCLFGLAGAVAALIYGPAINRSSSARGATTFVAGPLGYLVLLNATLIDEGIGSPLAIGLLAPLPLLGLHLPRTLVAALGGGAAVVYLGLAIGVGVPSFWHVLFHLAGMGVVTAASVARKETTQRDRATYTDLSLADSLTDTLNRRGLEDRFQAEVARSYRHGGKLTLLTIDLDAYDDARMSDDPSAARDLLRLVAANLTEVVRAHDAVGRLDDEFVVLLSDCTGAQAAAMAERVRRRLASHTSVQIGAATLGQHGSDFASLYESAVTARGSSRLYRADPA